MTLAIPAGDWACPNCGLTSQELREQERRKSHIAALLREREGYEAEGDEEKIAAVDASLHGYGYDAPQPRGKRAA